MSYIKDNFLLTNKTAVRLYENYAKDMPIFDYHCHLPEKQILENKEQAQKIYEKLYEMKVVEYVKSQVKVTTKAVSSEDFAKLAQEA